MKDKKQLLAELTLMQETARNAQQAKQDVVLFHSKRIAEFAEAAIAELDRSYERAAKVLGNFAQRLKEHWKNSPSLFNTIDKELAQAILELRETEEKSFPAADRVRVIVEDGKTQTSRTIEAKKIKIFFISESIPQVMEFSRNSIEAEEFALYAAMKRRCEMIDEEQDGFFSALYDDINKTLYDGIAKTPPQIIDLDEVKGEA